jgi:hypothetical protein
VTLRRPFIALVAAAVWLAASAVPVRAQSIAATSFEVPPPGALTWGVAGTNDLDALIAAQAFDVAAAFVFDPPTRGFLRFIPGAPPQVNTLTASALEPDTVVILRRRGGTSLLDHAQVVSYYGHPDVPRMGILGAHPTPLAAARSVERLASRYDALNGDRSALAAFHIVVAVAQRFPGADGSYLGRLDHDRIRSYIEVARDRGMLVFLDVQVGWAEPVDEARRLAPLLEEPFVHLALDPEYATRPDGQPPGSAVGTLDADQVNRVQEWLASLVRDHHLPPKILVIHQFREDMLDRPDRFARVDEVELLIDVDGFGPRLGKLSKYQRFGLSDYAERSGLKLFFDWDVNLLQPHELQALDPPPDLVIYQ